MNEKGNAMLAASQPPWYRERWPWLLAIMPTTAVIAGFITLWLAIKSDDGLVTDDYYKDGLAINKIIERDEFARQHHIGAIAHLKGSAISLQLDGSLLTLPDSLRFTLSHPTRKGLDHVVLLTRTPSGFYEGKVDALLDAHYDIILEPLEGGWRIAGMWHPAEGETLSMRSASLEPGK
jgi:hypothetical protein